MVIRLDYLFLFAQAQTQRLLYPPVIEPVVPVRSEAYQQQVADIKINASACKVLPAGAPPVVGRKIDIAGAPEERSIQGLHLPRYSRACQGLELLLGVKGAGHNACSQLMRHQCNLGNQLQATKVGIRHAAKFCQHAIVQSRMHDKAFRVFGIIYLGA